MKRIFFFTVLMSSCIFIAGTGKKTDSSKRKIEPVARWSGTVTFEAEIIHSNAAFNGKVEIHATGSFTDALPTMNRDIETTEMNFTDDKGKGYHKVHAEITDILKRKCIDDCEGNGQAELHSVIVREWDNTYDIEVIFPDCVGTGNCQENGVYQASPASATISNHQLTNKNILAGTNTVTRELPGGYATVTSTTTWHLTRVKEDDVELIVTPVDYDTWLPEPGKNELTKGSMMTVNLKLQGTNGKPLKAKAESFELTLNNTSTEPGITINYPIEPDPNQLPDLRFLHLPVIESTESDQFISISSPDGINGKTYIGSYDGGGWTILKAEAILTDGRRVQGKLLKPGGEIDIRIPKRDPNSHIGEVWLKANGNPGEKDDKDTSRSNTNNGDGLSAYEEYRGVISEAEFGKKNRNKFGRLDPLKKDVGVKVDKAEMPLFSTGINWFESTTGLNVIRFNETEIPPYRWLNENAKTAHIYTQYVLNLYKGPLSHISAFGSVFTSGQDPDIPAKTYAVVIDLDRIKIAYNNRVAKEKPASLPFTLAEFTAKVISHELGHGVAAWHHGQKPDLLSPIAVIPGPPISVQTWDGTKWNPSFPPSVRIFDRKGVQVSLPYTIDGNIGVPGNTDSGDVDCIMCYVPFSCNWAYTTGADGAWIFNEVPLLKVGIKMCNSANGTSINRSLIYFGDAVKGNCLSQIKLK